MLEISIVIPSYNRAHLLIDTLNSVHIQSYFFSECIVVDDYSTDNTKQIVKSFSLKDPRFKYLLNQRSKGAQGARNTGVLNSKGDWICFLDSDDLLTQDSIKDRIDFYLTLTSSNVGLIYGDSNCMFKRIYGNASNWMIKNMALCPFSVMLVNKEKVFKDYLLDENFLSWQDDDFIFDLSQKFEIFHCQKQVALWNPKGRDISITNSQKSQFNGLRLMIKKRRLLILKKMGIKYIYFWYLRLFILFLKNLDFEKRYSKFKIFTKYNNRIIKFFNYKILKDKFDPIHT